MDTLCVAMELATFMASRKELHATETTHGLINPFAVILNQNIVSS
jgi:hypothetical protein